MSEQETNRCVVCESEISAGKFCSAYCRRKVELGVEEQIHRMSDISLLKLAKSLGVRPKTQKTLME